MFKTFLVLLLLASAHFTFSDEIQKVDPLEDINRVFYELNFNLLDLSLIHI